MKLKKAINTVQGVLIIIAVIAMYGLAGGADHNHVAFSTSAGAVGLVFAALVVCMFALELFKSFRPRIRYKKTQKAAHGVGSTEGGKGKTS